VVLKYARQVIVLAAICLAPAVSLGQSLDELLKAVHEGDVKTVASFLDRGLDPNTTDRDGQTILMMATRLGHRNLVELLIARKANVASRSPQGDTALMFASLKGHLGIAELLVKHGAQVRQSGWTPLHYAAFEGRAEMIKFLLAKGAEVDARAPNAYTALMLAARGGHLEAARQLLYADPDLTAKGQSGETALGIAKARKAEGLVKLLQRAGAVD
jgi:ankyrin repeat protein